MLTIAYYTDIVLSVLVRNPALDIRLRHIAYKSLNLNCFLVFSISSFNVVMEDAQKLKMFGKIMDFSSDREERKEMYKLLFNIFLLMVTK